MMYNNEDTFVKNTVDNLIEIFATTYPKHKLGIVTLSSAYHLVGVVCSMCVRECVV